MGDYYCDEFEDFEEENAVAERNHRHNGVLFEGRRGNFIANISSDIPRMKPINRENIANWARKGVKPNVSKNPKLQPFHGGFSGPSGVIDMIDTFDRPGTADANSTYARSGTYAYGGENKPGERIPKAGAYAEAGVGEANAKWSIFEAEAKGPNAGAHAGASVTGVSAMATAGVGTASAKAGPVGMKVGLQLDTGVSVGVDGLEAKVLGIGLSVGPKTGISFLGNEVYFDLF
ncbi:unnamed protein product [Mytilus coruscus]|uniref:Uncharacterized protein n=1 Tax=Mytilus coruscus TaxID=42192 RepID=A0A6J8D6V1_MYTCO|nr:unnamed protein product [Mytilus coruscus]